MPTQDRHLAHDDGDSSVARRLRSFTKRILQKVASPLLPRPPAQPTSSTSVLLLRSKRLAAQGLSRVPASKRGEVLIMPHMALTIGFSSPSTSGKKIYEDLFETEPSASNVEVLHTLFLDTG